MGEVTETVPVPVEDLRLLKAWWIDNAGTSDEAARVLHRIVQHAPDSEGEPT